MGIVNKDFKDGVFCRLFGAAEYKENLLSLFNALNGTDYRDAAELTINTIDDVIFMGIKNDASCIIDMQMDLYEEQSTYNPNAPLRGLMYFGRLYEGYIAERGLNRYGSKLIRLPRPRYYVLYLGVENRPDREVLKLSDAFANADGDFAYEWTAIVLNVNDGHNTELLDACRVLKEYSQFVECSRRHLRKAPKDRPSQYNAMREAVDECIGQGILVEFLTKNKAGVINMYLTEWDEEAYRTVLKQESWEDGKIEGRAEVREEINELNQCLIRDKRIEDLQKSTTDQDYQNSLLAEYGIGSYKTQDKLKMT